MPDARFQDFHLPPEWAEDLLPAIRAHLIDHPTKVVVLDDDPTGTQTVHGIPVLTEWSRETLATEMRAHGPGFYILTNSRAFPVSEACAINREIGERLAVEAAAAGVKCVVISRSDSTLRGHFPDEVEALGSALGNRQGNEGESSAATNPSRHSGGRYGGPPILLCPYFEAGGRFTIDDVHYVAEGDRLVPAAETPFAKDAAFGFRSSSLRDWVVEKSRGDIRSEQISALTLADIRERGPQAIAEKLRLSDGSVCIANAVSQRDLEVIVFAALLAEVRGARTIYRTAASFVATRMGLESKPLLTVKELATSSQEGGLTIVGSYVPKTTQQLSRVLDQSIADAVELDVAKLLSSGSAKLLDATMSRLNASLADGHDAVVFTSRTLVTGESPTQGLAIAARISEALVELVRRLETRPRYLIAKGGITSSDVATRGLGVRRAMVLGQLLPGVPVWELGAETRFPGVPYIVFPGNVGGTDALRDAIQLLSKP